MRRAFGADLGRGPDRHIPQSQYPKGIPSNERTPSNFDINVSADGKSVLAGILHTNLHKPDLHSSAQPALPVLLDEVHDLVRSGILRPVPGTEYNFTITAPGAACLDADDPDLPPHSAERVQQFRERFAGVPDLDLLARHYAEAISTYRDGHDCRRPS